jgi:hypothetical protein
MVWGIKLLYCRLIANITLTAGLFVIAKDPNTYSVFTFMYTEGINIYEAKCYKII